MVLNICSSVQKQEYLLLILCATIHPLFALIYHQKFEVSRKERSSLLIVVRNYDFCLGLFPPHLFKTSTSGETIILGMATGLIRIGYVISIPKFKSNTLSEIQIWNSIKLIISGMDIIQTNTH